MLLGGSTCVDLFCCSVPTFQESLSFAIKCIAASLEMHEVRAVADLQVALVRGVLQSIEQPARIGIGHEMVPGAADDRNRRSNGCRIICEMAGECLRDFLNGAAGHF